MDPARTLTYRGCRLSYAVRGEGPPALLIHGVGVHGGGWRPQTDVLSRRYRCLTFDNRGMGRSLPVGAPLSVGQMAEDARALMDAEGWASAHVVGHSLGGLVALELALSAPERVRSLALLCTAARGAEIVRPSAWALWVGIRLHVGTPRQRRRAFLELGFPPAILASADRDRLAEGVAPLYGYDLARQPRIVLRQAAAARRYDATTHLPRLRGIHTLVVSAASDRIALPASGRALGARIPGSRYVEVPDAGHAVPFYAPETLNSLLMEHLDGVERGGRGAGSPSP